MEIKPSQSHPSPPERNVQASRRSDEHEEQRERDISTRDARQEEREQRMTQSAAQGSEARFFALESRQENEVDPRLQVRAMRERVRQAYSEQAQQEARREVQEQQAQDVHAEELAQRNETRARDPIDLIA